MKYNVQLAEAQRLLPQAQNILVALPAKPSIDHLAASLALYLSLQQVNHSCSIVSDGPILVGHTNLFGVGQIQNKLPSTSGGNYVLTLVGVASLNDPDKPVPAVEKMDYKAEGADLKLIFNIVPGQRFEPQAVVPSYQGGGFDLIFVIGSQSLNALGGIYNLSPAIFSSAHLVNIDNQPQNSQFGQTNIIDQAAPCLSEMVAQILPGLALPLENDVASNILNGIYFATQNLQAGNVTADTFLIVAEALRAGGQKPVLTQELQPLSGATSVSNPPSWFTQAQSDQAKAFADAFTVPPVVAAPSSGEKPSEAAASSQPQPSPEERPAGEAVTSSGEIVSPEPDWLTPKIFKGGGLG